MTVTGSLIRQLYVYTDDFGQDILLSLAESIGDAAGLKVFKDSNMTIPQKGGGFHPRYVQIRSILVDGKRYYKDLPVQKISSLWKGPLGQRVLLAGVEFETIKKVDERQYGVKGAAEARRKIKEAERQAEHMTSSPSNWKCDFSMTHKQSAYTSFKKWLAELLRCKQNRPENSWGQHSY